MYVYPSFLQVIMVDTNKELMDKAVDRISTSLQRVAKKQFATDEMAAKTYVDQTLVCVWARSGEKRRVCS